MRFRFCWDLDCPDWLLAEIATLSRLTSVKLRLLAGHVTKGILGQEFKYDNAAKLTSDAKLDTSATQAAIAALRWILDHAAGGGVPSAVLESELQQLGLPKEHAAAIAKVYIENKDKLELTLRNQTLRASSTNQFSSEVVGAWTHNTVHPLVQLSFHGSAKDNDESNAASDLDSVVFTADQLHIMIQDLTEARDRMATLAEV
ncbi:COMM domain-containing protein 4 [Oratosquilla oratoria]|uniref:COMM domain-containing protein 4 n=1 Tax=Oratosquilla oratoria TaxID=337810 RepID=UPI003F760283